MSHHRPRMTKAKILLLGHTGVGKTAFAVRYITKRFIGEYEQDKEMMYTHKIILDKDEVTLDIMDLANDTNDEALVNHIKWADGFVMLYSITDKASVKKLEYLQKLLRKHKKCDATGHIPLLVVANKTDLTHARKVSEAEGCEISKKFDCPVFEISIADSYEGVQDAMAEILRQTKKEFIKMTATAYIEKKSAFMSVKKAFRKKVTRSRSDTSTTAVQQQ